MYGWHAHHFVDWLVDLRQCRLDKTCWPRLWQGQVKNPYTYRKYTLLKIVFFHEVIVLMWFDLILKIQKRLRSLKFLVKNFTFQQRDLLLYIPKLYFPFSSKNRPPHNPPPPPPKEATRLARWSSSCETVNLKMSFLFRPTIQLTIIAKLDGRKIEHFTPVIPMVLRSRIHRSCQIISVETASLWKLSVGYWRLLRQKQFYAGGVLTGSLEFASQLLHVSTCVNNKS